MREANGGAAEPSLAAAWLRGGIAATSRSFRMHRPRGPYCADGSCHRCPVRVRGGGTALSCELPASAAASRARFDVLRPAGSIAERLPPWFYERRFLRPASLRRVYLEAIRRLSAAPALGPAPPRGARPPADALRTDALVVGAGSSGLAAAAALAERGVDVVIVERETEVGGRSKWNGARPAASPSYARLLTSSTCLGLYRGEGIAGVLTPLGPVEVRFDRVVIATGAYDRPLAYEGNDLPGTVGARAFERLAAQGAFSPDVRLGLVAAPVEAERALAAARAHGLRFAWAAGPVDLPEDAAPIVAVDRMVAASGRRRVRQVRLAAVGASRTDVLVVGFTQPTYELAVHAGAAARIAGAPAVVVADGPTSVPALVVGEAAGGMASDDRAIADAVARWLDEGDATPPAPPPTLPPASQPVVGAFVCFCEDVRVRDIEAAVADGFADAELVKRRTGAGTGPCQGAYCLGEVAATLDRLGVPSTVPTVRPPMHAVTLADLAVADG